MSVNLTYKRTSVRFSSRALRSLDRLPALIATAAWAWKRTAEEVGIEELRKVLGYHDEPLHGKLRGIVRSARLGRGYRLYYREIGSVEQALVLVIEEINRHDYKAIERIFS